MYTMTVGNDQVDDVSCATGFSSASGKIRLPERCYREVSVNRVENGFVILLDGQKVMTPARNDLVLPNRALAVLVADEFRFQEKVINPQKMFITRLANTVVDGIVGNSQPIIEDILHFAATDLLFYRAEGPVELVVRQRELWDPVLDWVARDISAHFLVGEGVVHIKQPGEAVGAVSLYLRRFTSPFALAAIHTMANLTGSALIALGITAGEIDVATGWKLANLDEDWTVAQWGEDRQAMTRHRYREDEMYAAAAVFSAS